MQREGTVDSSDRATARRGDIEGLRAIAVLVVMAWHAGLPLFSGGFVGVDVFFVISGFLITSLLLREVEATGRISLTAFYARRMKRLLPAAAVVLVATLAMTYLFLPVTRWATIGGDAIASALYVVNWRLSGQAVDYLAEDASPSPFQHFWSLAIEEQFYLFWPLLILLALWIARRRGRLLRLPLLVIVAAVALPSLAWSAYLTSANPGAAYFVSTTRIWELAIGAALAIAWPLIPVLTRSAAAVLGSVGLLAIAVAALGFSPATPFPGTAALLPTVGAAMVILAGARESRAGARWLLDRGPMRWVGALSYSLYLWHWPLVVVASAAFSDAGAWATTAAVVFSFVPAYCTYRWVETPARQPRAWGGRGKQALHTGLLVTLASATAGVLFAAMIPTVPPLPTPVVMAALASTVEERGEAAPMGAGVLAESPRGDPAGAPVDTVEQMTPAPAQARNDLPDVYARGCHADDFQSEPTVCSNNLDDAEITIAVAGDSHAAQWLPAASIIAEENGWRLNSYTKSGCHVSLAMMYKGEDQSPYTSCREWNEQLVDVITDLQPDLFVVSNVTTVVTNEDRQAELREGIEQSWGPIVDAGIPVVVIADTPVPDLDVPECVAEEPDRLSECAAPRDVAVGERGKLQRSIVEAMPGVDLIDLNDAICPVEECAAVIGGVLVYRDTNHLTATYVRTLAPRLDEEIKALLAD